MYLAFANTERRREDTAGRASCQVDVLVVFVVISVTGPGLDRSLDPQAHASLPRVQLGDLRQNTSRKRCTTNELRIHTTGTLRADQSTRWMEICRHHVLYSVDTILSTTALSDQPQHECEFKGRRTQGPMCISSSDTPGRSRSSAAKILPRPSPPRTGSAGRRTWRDRVP